jgi:hypothetical protein
MKLKVTPKGEQRALELKMQKEQNQKRGKRSRNKGSSYEREIAEKFRVSYNAELMRTPQSGGFAKKSEKAEDFRGDIVPVDKSINLNLHIECKNQKAWALPAWITQAESDCPKSKHPVIVFHKHQTSKDYVCLSLEDFFKLVPKSNVITARKEV